MVGVLVLIAWNLILVYISSNVPCFGRPLPIWIQTMRREFFRWVFGSFLLFVLILLLLSAVWCLFAALLHPSEFLPWTAAIVTFFAVIAWQANQLKTSAAKLRADIKAEYTSKIRATVARLERAERELKDIEDKQRKREARMAEGAAAGGDGAPAAGGSALTHRAKTVEAVDDANEEGFDPGSLFDLLDTDGNDSLSKEEFMQMVYSGGARTHAAAEPPRAHLSPA